MQTATSASGSAATAAVAATGTATTTSTSSSDSVEHQQQRRLAVEARAGQWRQRMQPYAFAVLSLLDMSVRRKPRRLLLALVAVLVVFLAVRSSQRPPLGQLFLLWAAMAVVGHWLMSHQRSLEEAGQRPSPEQENQLDRSCRRIADFEVTVSDYLRALLAQRSGHPIMFYLQACGLCIAVYFASAYISLLTVLCLASAYGIYHFSEVTAEELLNAAGSFWR